jgi:hypothetical protein
MSIELWKAIFDWAAVVLIGLTFIAGSGALITGRILNDRQSAQLQKMNTDLTKAQTDLAKAQKDASDAQAGNKQLGISLETAKSETEQREKELATEQRKTAEAQLKAAEVQLALRKATESAAASRRIVMGNRNGDESIRRAKFEEVSKYRDTAAIILFVSDDEAEILAHDIEAALLSCGWNSVSVASLASTSIPSGFIQEGVQIRTMLPINPSDASVPPSGATPPLAAKGRLKINFTDSGRRCSSIWAMCRCV